tara:strand:+ start:513 stop:1211 length:699 start_codon:yes stop_codon:yes gene_type:complete
MPRNNKNKIKILKAKGGADASKSDFGSSGNKGSDHSHSRFDVGSGYYGETKTVTQGNGGKGTTQVNVPPPQSKDSGFKINPVTTGLNIAGAMFTNIPGVGYAVQGLKNLQKSVRTKSARGETLFGNPKKGGAGMPITRDYYKTTGKPLDVMSKQGTSYMKDAGLLKGPKTTNTGGGDNKVQLCPDGSYPPCKTPTTQIKTPITKPNTFLSGFQAYDDGGEVVISSNVDKSLL